MFLRRPLPVAAALTVLFATATSGRADDAPKGDLGKFQGKWATRAGIDKDIDIVLVIKGSAATVTVVPPQGDEIELKGEIVVNEEAKPHKTIDWVKFTGPDGNDLADNPGIYAFEDDDTITVCSGGAGNERPTEFKVGDRGQPQVLSLKRVKTEKAEAPEGDLGKFQGSWVAKVGPDRDVEIELAIEGTDVNLTMNRDGQELAMKGKVEIDDAAKPHKTITFKGFTRPDGNESPENLGIYTFEGDDTVKVCSGGPGNERPTEFRAGEGAPPTLLTLTRKAK